MYQSMTYEQIVEHIESHNIVLVKRWLDSGGDPNTGLKDGKFPLIQDVLDEIYEHPENDHLHDLLGAFVKHGATLNFENKEITPPLIEAIQTNSAKAVKILLDGGSDVSIEHRSDYPGYTPLLLAVENNNHEIVKMIVSKTKRELIDFTGGYQVVTALGCAFQNLHLPIIKELLMNGANPYLQEWDHAYQTSLALIPVETSEAQRNEIEKMIAEFCSTENEKE